MNDSKIALLIIDMINDFDFVDGEKLFHNALPAAKNILTLKQYAREHNVPVIYVNDNFGKWKSDFNILIQHCINDNTIGKEIVQLLHPDENDYFVLKPMHSAFYSTALDILLKFLKVDTLIITGVKTESCVFATCIDAYMRNYKIIIPTDCVASLEELPEVFFDILESDFKAEILYSTAIEF